MKYVPDNPPMAIRETGGLDAYPLSGVKSAKPVQERTLPPLVVHHPVQFDAAAAEITRQQEKRHATDVLSDRRTYCRRIEHPSFLVELRSRMERRRHKQRMADATEHVDEEV